MLPKPLVLSSSSGWPSSKRSAPTFESSDELKTAPAAISQVRDAGLHVFDLLINNKATMIMVVIFWRASSELPRPRLRATPGRMVPGLFSVVMKTRCNTSPPAKHNPASCLIALLNGSEDDLPLLAANVNSAIKEYHQSARKQAKRAPPPR